MASIYSGYKTPQEFEESIKGLSPEAQAAYRTGFTSSSVGEGSLFQDLLNRTMDPEYLRAQLKAKSEFDKEQMKAAYPYQFAAQLPGMIGRMVNPMADPTTAAIVLNRQQQGFQGMENIYRGIPQIGQSGSQIGFQPKGNYFG
jgi:hypothetical protein